MARLVCRSPCIERLLTIAVSNGGEAIPPKTMERLFQPFFRSEEDGLGLGLHVAPEIGRPTVVR